MEDESIKPTDRISDLPQPIIHHILSFLPVDDNVKLDLKRLSKTWYKNTSSCPYIDFNDFLYGICSLEEKQIDNYASFVTRTLQRFLEHNHQILRLTIAITFRLRVVPDLDNWISLALQHGVEELNLEIRPPIPRDESYNLPRPVLYANSIKVVKLEGCSLLQSTPHDGSCSSSLLKLCLDDVVLDDPTFSSIIARCPLIEDLSIICCRGMNCVQISNLHKLKTLRIILKRESSTVHIEASSLQSLDILGHGIEILDSLKLTHLNAKTLKEAKLVRCSLLQSIPPDLSCSNLVKLYLDYVILDEVILSSIFSTCPLIEDLSILHCMTINCVRISNLHKLKALQIIPSTGDLTVEIDAPCLQSLHIRGSVKIDILECPKLTHLDLNIYKEFKLQHILSRLSLLRSLCVSNMFWLTKFKVSSNTLNELKVFDCNMLVELEIDAPNLVSGGWGVSNRYGSFRNPYMAEDFAIELSNFVSKAKHLKYLCLQFKDQVQPFIFNEVNKGVSPVANIDHLELRISSDFWMSAYPDHFDGVLWSCHPRTLSLKFNCYNNYYYDCVVKCMHRIIASHRHSCSCTLARSWLHHLEDVTYVTEDGIEEQLPMDENCIRRYCKEMKFHFKW